MNNLDYKLLEVSFFNMYQSILNHLRLTRKENTLYDIYISRTKTHDNLLQVMIKIENKNNDQNFVFCDKLPLEEASDLIDKIRIDFRENHYIAFSSVNQMAYIQTLQNTNFTLRIELKNEEEVAEAINFNSRINTNGERHKVLRKA